jgi:hypothetical protein
MEILPFYHQPLKAKMSVLWTPSVDDVKTSNLTKFINHVNLIYKKGKRFLIILKLFFL